MRVLVACEESQAVTIEFRKLGHEAYSCDLLPCSGGHPEWHWQIDVFEAMKARQWDLMIAFPPCTHLAVSGAAWFEQKRKDGRQKQGIDFFMKIIEQATWSGIKHWAIENPVGIMSQLYRRPDQIIQPYRFGDPYQKTTCLWLHNLPKLKATHSDAPLWGESIDRGEFMEYVEKKTGKVKKMAKWYNDARSGDHGHKRSKTFPGIAKAMADQWGGNRRYDSKYRPTVQGQLF